MKKASLLALSLSASLLTGVAQAQQKTPLWGWADLHAHPASHLGFGADADGNNGMFWGKPGMNLEASRATLLTDLPACAPDKHGSFDGDVVRHKTHQTVIGTVDNISGFPHESNGAGGFKSWPHARSLTHQQMHITNIRRAYEGGQRLMIASVTDSELLASLWTKIGYNAAGNQVPLPDPNFGYKSAKRQLDFIQKMAAANPSWMEIADSAADARRIIGQNKLALILSLEMDTLSPEQIQKLVKEEHVRHVIPIHLINNSLGGCAVYTDAFNTANTFVNATRDSKNWNNPKDDAFFRIVTDPKLSVHLALPQTLVAEGSNLLQGGAIWPRCVDSENTMLMSFLARGYNYTQQGPGHRNALGLTSEGTATIRNLAKQGILIDVAHMSQQSTSGTMLFALVNKYPVMDSHTGLRAPDETAPNERYLMREHARMISNLGGVIGLGTEGLAGQVPILNLPEGMPSAQYYFDFDSKTPNRKWNVDRLPGNPVVSNLTVTVKTGDGIFNGGADLRGGNNGAWAWVTIRGKRHEYDLSKRAQWPAGSTRTVTFALPAGTHSRDIDSFGLHTTPDGKNEIFDTSDGWRVAGLKVEATLAGVDTVGTWLEEYKDALSIMKGRGMAIGTDINGFAPQMAFSADSVNYPLTAARRFGKPDAPALAKDHMGSRTFDFKKDGIAHYGMLADFMQAVSQKPGSDTAMKTLFHSANDVVEMWEKCEEAAKKIK
ncbi:MAG: membrane dipeptidase [Armatimonas sp.]